MQTISQNSTQSAVYQVGGCLSINHPSYVKRPADDQLYLGLKAARFCYILQPHHTGKSSLRLRTIQRLRADGHTCISLDLSTLVRPNMTAEQWYARITTYLSKNLNLVNILNVEKWWQAKQYLPPEERFTTFIEEVILAKVQSNIVIFIDQIEEAINSYFAIENFLNLIAKFYQQREDNPNYERLDFAVLGVANKSELITENNAFLFQTGREINLMGIELAETNDLSLGLSAKTNTPQGLMQEILAWSNGQPFLTQKICQLVQDETGPIPHGKESQWLTDLIQNKILTNWEKKDQPKHLTMIRDRILNNPKNSRSQLLLYQEIIPRVSSLNLPKKYGKINNNVADLIKQKEETTNGTNGTNNGQISLPKSLSSGNNGQNGNGYAYDQSNLIAVPRLAIDETSPEVKQLLLSGLIVKDDHKFSVGNRIYGEIFNRKWVEKSLKTSFSKNSQKSLSTPSNLVSKEPKSLPLSGTEKVEVIAQLEQERKHRQLAETVNKFTGLTLIGLAIGIAILWNQQPRFSNFSKNQNITSSVNSEANSLIISAEKLTPLYQLESLITAIKAGKKVKQIGSYDDTKIRVIATLQQLLYQIQEYNRIPGYNFSFSPKGELIATATKNGDIKLWNFQGKNIVTLSGNNLPVTSINFSADGQTIAAGYSNGTIKLWNISGQELKNFSAHNGGINRIIFSPTDPIFATTALDKTIKIWGYDGKKLRSIETPSVAISIDFNQDGKTIAAATLDGTIRLWGINGKRQAILKGHTAAAIDVKFSPNGQMLASASGDNTVKIWSVEGKLINTLAGHSASVIGVTFSPDGQTIASGGADNTIELWEINGKKKDTFKVLGVNHLSFSPDGKILAASDGYGTVKMWQLENKKQVIFPANNQAIKSLNFNPDGHTIAAITADKTIKIFTVYGQEINTLSWPENANLMILSPNGKTIAADDANKTINLWNFDGLWHFDLTPKQTLTSSGGTLKSLIFSPDGKSLAATDNNEDINLWNSQGKYLGLLQGHNDNISSMSFSPDAQKLASGSWDGLIKIWNIKDKKALTFNGHNAGVTSIIFSPDGKSIASASADNTLKLWNLQGQPKAIFKGHSGPIWLIKFSPNGQILASASADNTIKIWNKDGQELATFKGHKNWINSLSFSPNGKKLVSGSDDGSIMVWDLDLDDLLIQSCRWLNVYLQNKNANITQNDRKICQGIGGPKK